MPPLGTLLDASFDLLITVLDRWIWHLLAIFSSASTTQFLLAAFDQRNGDGNPYVTFDGVDEPCPIPQFFTTLTFFDGSRQKFFDLLCEHTQASTTLRKRFVGSINCWIDRVAKLDKKTVAVLLDAEARKYNYLFPPKHPMDLLMRNLIALSTGIDTLCSRHPLILSEFLTSRYPEAMCKAFTKWLIVECDERDPLDIEHRSTGFLTLCQVLKMLECDGSTRRRQCFRAVRSMIDGGILELILEGVRTMTRDEAEWSYMATLLLTFKAHAAYPTIAPKAQEVFDRMGGAKSVASRRFLDGNANENGWKILSSDVTIAAQTTNSYTGVVNLCDNMKCAASRKFETSKTCAGCQSVVYCSYECQRADWDALHRTECGLARADYLALAPDKAEYSHRLRLFHTQVLAAKLLSGILPPNKDNLNKNVVVIDSWAGPVKYPMWEYPHYHRLSVYEDWDKKAEHYFDKRILALFGMYMQYRGDTIVVEGIWRYGEKEVFTTAMFEWVDRAKVRLMCSVSRIGPHTEARVVDPEEAQRRARL